MENKKSNLLYLLSFGVVFLALATILVFMIITNKTKSLNGQTGGIYSGSEIPSENEGSYGDLFLNTDSFFLYKKNKDGKWELVGAINKNENTAVSSIKRLSSADNVETYEMSFIDGTKSTFQIYNNEAVLPEITIVDGFWAINGVKTDVKATAAEGKGILKIEYKESTNDKNIYTITYTDNTNSLLEIPKGANGDTPRIGENGNWFIGDVDTGVKASGGRGIKSISKKESSGLVDTYVITFDDDTTFEFDVTNAVQEKDIVIGENGTWVIGGVDTNIKATGTGVSSVEVDDDGILIIKLTDGTTERFDVLSKFFGGDYKVTFHINGYVDPTLETEDQKIVVDVKGGRRLEKPDIEIKRGYKLDGWYNIDDEKWIFSVYTVAFNLDLYAKYSKKNFTITLDNNGGEVEVDKIDVLFEEDFVLPEATKEGFDFNGWYYNNELVTSGKYEFDEDITLVASFTEKETDTFSISTPVDFNKVYDNLDKNFILKNDIDLQGINLKSFGDENNPFTGTFDGQGYTISNFNINSDSDIYSALFNYNKGTIKNLILSSVKNEDKATNTSILVGLNEGSLEDIEITSSSANNADGEHQAILVAYNNSDALIKNINIGASISATETRTDDFMIGSVIAYSEADVNLENINSTSNITVKLNIDKVLLSEMYNQKTYVGGLIGQIINNKALVADKIKFSGAVDATLGVVCDRLNLETYFGSIGGFVDEAHLNKVVASGYLTLINDGVRTNSNTLENNNTSHISNYLASLISKINILEINDIKMESIIYLENNLKAAYKATNDYNVDIFLDNYASAIGNNLSNLSGKNIYSNITLDVMGNLDPNHQTENKNNSIEVKNSLAGMVSNSTTVVVENVIVDIKAYDNKLSFTDNTNCTKIDALRYSFIDVDGQTTNINKGIFKSNPSFIDNTVGKLVRNDNYLNNEQIFDVLGFDDALWSIVEDQLELNF